MPIKTKNFNLDTDPKLACTCGHSKCDKRTPQQGFMDRLQKLRDLADRPLTVTSGGRCPNHKNEFMRKTPADHQKGLAVDIAVAGGNQRAELVSLGIKCGFNAIGVAKTFVHLGYRYGSLPVMWVYP